MRRRISIYVHIISGCLEFITCWVAFCINSERMATIAALSAILGHVPSAYYQASIAFGAKALMVPAYLFAISLHLFCALHLFIEPSSAYWLLNMFLVHNTYVWCRVFYFCFDLTGLFKETLYTNTILISGLILFPAVLGISANILFLCYIVTSILLYYAIVRPDVNECARFVSEHTRDLLVNRTVHDAWKKEKVRLMKMKNDDKRTEQQLARQVFDQLDENNNGIIDGEEVIYLLREWNAAKSFIERFLRFSKKREITFEIFYKNVWRLGEIAAGRAQETQKLEDNAKARFVFNNLDIDLSGYIDAIELEKLLIQWGLPENEVDAYLAKDDDGRFSFEEFYHHLKPIWNFAYEHMKLQSVAEVTQPIHHDHANVETKFP